MFDALLNQRHQIPLALHVPELGITDIGAAYELDGDRAQVLERELARLALEDQGEGFIQFELVVRIAADTVRWVVRHSSVPVAAS